MSAGSVSLVFAGLGGGVEDAAAKPALASMLATIWVNEYDDERDARFINDRVHDNIQKGGTMLVCPRHDRTFDLRTGESLTSDCQLRTYPVRVAEDGRIMLERIAVSAE